MHAHDRINLRASADIARDIVKRFSSRLHDALSSVVLAVGVCDVVSGRSDLRLRGIQTAHADVQRRKYISHFLNPRFK